MSFHDRHVVALIELMAIKPPVFLPPCYLSIAVAMREQGLATIQQDCWYPTALGLMHAGRSLH